MDIRIRRTLLADLRPLPVDSMPARTNKQADKPVAHKQALAPLAQGP
jgi:hypothetical protein